MKPVSKDLTINIKSFSGEPGEDIAAWLQSLEDLFVRDNTTSNRARLAVMSTMFKGKAMAVFQEAKKAHPGDYRAIRDHLWNFFRGEDEQCGAGLLTLAKAPVQQEGETVNSYAMGIV